MYVVQPGDSPANIAARDEMAGCPRCARDLVRANPHKRIRTHPNGFVTFEELRVGEKLNLPEKWFDGTLDRLPKSYFERLPSHDGVTGVGTLGDYATLDEASASVDALARTDDGGFAYGVDNASALTDKSVAEASSSSNTTAVGYAQDTKASTYWARTRAAQMSASLTAGDQTAATQARTEIQKVLDTAIGSARAALQAYYGGVQVDIGPATIDTFPANVTSAAQAANSALTADTNYCASVARVGSTVNSSVHGFKLAWNTSQSPAVPINTGNYEQPTADALKRVLGSAPTACPARGAAPTPSTPTITPPVLVASTAPKPGLSTGSIVGISALGAGAVGTVIYLATRKRRRT